MVEEERAGGLAQLGCHGTLAGQRERKNGESTIGGYYYADIHTSCRGRSAQE